jgi:hypothetical protein
MPRAYDDLQRQTQRGIPAGEEFISDSHLSLEEMIDKKSVPDSIDRAEKAAQTAARAAEEAEEIHSCNASKMAGAGGIYIYLQPTFVHLFISYMHTLQHASIKCKCA